jgi:heme-degrading monooxygenase HmoA
MTSARFSALATTTKAPDPMQGVAVMAQARRRGLSVPADLSVVGFIDPPEAALADPPLTTVDGMNTEKGRAVARMVFECGQRRRVVLPTRLLVRRSTAPRAGEAARWCILRVPEQTNGGNTMIVRVFQVRVQDGKSGEFEEFFRGTALPLVRSQPGLVSVTAGLPRAETPDEFCMVMVWRDLDALKAFAGEEWRDPHVLPEEAALVRERSIRHYELAEA